MIRFKMRAIFICILSAIILPINIFAENPRLLKYNAVKSENKIIIECPKPFLKGDRDINREIPLYRFKDTIKGQFLERFCDSLSKVSNTMNSIIIMPLTVTGHADEVISEYQAIYLKTTLIGEKDIDKAKGALLTSDNNICLLDSLTPIILENADCIMKAKYNVELRYSEDFLPDQLRQTILHLNEFQMACAALLIEPTGKIDVVNFYINYEKFQDNKNIKYHNLFDWMEAFYQINGYDSGCLFINQPGYKNFMNYK